MNLPQKVKFSSILFGGLVELSYLCTQTKPKTKNNMKKISTLVLLLLVVLTGSAQRKAVATLMRYVGQMVNMSYSPEISLSFHDPAVELMPKYFNYDKGIRSIFRYDYTIDEWENTIYNELEAKRPVVYGAMKNWGRFRFSALRAVSANGLRFSIISGTKKNLGIISRLLTVQLA